MSNGNYYYINVYKVIKCYGGPENGGWYYNQGTLLQTVPVCSNDNVKAIKHSLQKSYAHIKQGNVYRGGSALLVSVDEQMGADYPTTKPTYQGGKKRGG